MNCACEEERGPDSVLRMKHPCRFHGEWLENNLGHIVKARDAAVLQNRELREALEKLIPIVRVLTRDSGEAADADNADGLLMKCLGKPQRERCDVCGRWNDGPGIGCFPQKCSFMQKRKYVDPSGPSNPPEPPQRVDRMNPEAGEF